MDEDLRECLEFLMEHEERSFERRRRLPQRYIRDAQNSLEKLRDNEFEERYRFEKTTVVDLLFPMVASLEKKDNRGFPISAMMKLLIALRFYAKGLDQEDNGDMHGVSTSSVCAIVKEVSILFANELRRYVKLPNQATSVEFQRKFFKIKEMPGIIGCVDGTHTKINNPGRETAEIFRNRKTFFSFNVKILAGPSMEILDLTCRYPGSCHDARIFRLSGLGIPFEQGEMEVIILGDSAYPCETYLFTSMANPMTDAEGKYNKAHRSTRNLAERTIGSWKNRFRCLKGMNLKVHNVATVVCATSALHNIAKVANDRLVDEVTADSDDEEAIAEVSVVPQDGGLVAR